VVKLLKAIGTASRRSAAMPGPLILEAEDVAQVCSLELATGHYNWLVDWEKEAEEKAKPSPTLEAYDPQSKSWTEEAFLEKAKRLIT
jgi:hypothetical protein